MDEKMKNKDLVEKIEKIIHDGKYSLFVGHLDEDENIICEIAGSGVGFLQRLGLLEHFKVLVYKNEKSLSNLRDENSDN